MKSKSYVYVVAAIAAMGGLLFGFDTGVISGAIPFMQANLQVSDSQVEDITTLALVGALVGAAFAGYISDRLGRRRVILAASVIFLIGALWCGSASSVGSLMAARIFLGLAIGIASFSTPLYIAEISPAKIRGTLVSMFQLLITVGLLCAFVSDSLIANNTDSSCWRTMFYVGVAPAVALLVGMWFLPESPRWLLGKGREAEARVTLDKIEDPEVVEDEVLRMKQDISLQSSQLSLAQTFSQSWMRFPLMLAVLIMFFQQAVGINTVIYYGPSIFLKAGFQGAEAAVMASVSVGVVNVLFTVVSLFLIDRLGRRKLFFIGMAGMVLSLLLIAMGFVWLSSFGPFAVVGSMLMYIAFFAVSMGPLAWLLITEVFPSRVRGVGSSIGSLANWGFNSLVVWTFFKIMNAFSASFGSEAYGAAGSFVLFAVVALVGMAWGYFYLPETKGRSLSDIERHWKSGGTPRSL